jgi:flagellar hook-associated protein 3 FlgL
MISAVDPSALTFLTGLSQIQKRAQRAQQELTTGLKINNVSDDPSSVTMLVQAQADLVHTQQVNTNLDQVKNEVDTAEGALQSAVTLVERAQTLGTQAQSQFTTSDARSQIAQELGTILEQLVNSANSSTGGRYLFSGDSDQSAPYTIDLTQQNPVSAYAGSASTRQIEAPDGSKFSVALTAQQIFDSANPQTNVFQAVNAMRTALINNDQAAIEAALPNLQHAGQYLNQQLGFYGTSQNRVADAQNYGANLVTALQTHISNIQDADMAQAITDLTEAQTQQQAAMSSRAMISRKSLFDYLG